MSDRPDSLTTALRSLSRLAQALNSSRFRGPQTRSAELCRVVDYSQGDTLHTAWTSLMWFIYLKKII